MKQPFFNQWTNREETWDPDGPPGKRGTFFVTWREGPTEEYVKLSDGRTLRLGSDPQSTTAKALVSLAILIAKYPEVRDRLRVVQAPCLFSRPDSWITRAHADDIPPEVIHHIHGKQLQSPGALDHHAVQNIKDNYGLSTSYM